MNPKMIRYAGACSSAKYSCNDHSGGEKMDPRQKVERCIESFHHSAAELRAAARETENGAARNAFIASAQKVEECIQQCQVAINQFK